METQESFIRNLIGEDRYCCFKPYAGLIFLLYSVWLVILFSLTLICHWKILSDVFSLFTGKSMFFVLYIAIAILFLDVRVKVVYGLRNWKYKLTIAWGVVLIILGLSAVIYTNHYRKNYAFECETCFIEADNSCFHIRTKCNSIMNKESLEKSKVYKAKELGYILCEECEWWIEESIDTYEAFQYSRK